MLHKHWLIFLLSLMPMLAVALGLGSINVKSAMYQPLEAEIPLTSLHGTALEDIEVKLASTREFYQLDMERPFFLTQLRFDISRNEFGEPVVYVTTHKPMREPVVTFLVEVNWPQGRLLRAYSILLNPPTSVLQRQPAPKPLPQVSTRQEPVARPEQEPQPVMPQAQPALPQRSPQESSEELVYGPVKSSETLSGIAVNVKPAGDVSLAQTMMAIIAKNPTAFIGRNINRLMAGYKLRIPNHDEIASIPHQQAITEIMRQEQAYKAGTMVRGKIFKISAAAAPVPKPAPQPQQPTPLRMVPVSITLPEVPTEFVPVSAVTEPSDHVRVAPMPDLAYDLEAKPNTKELSPQDYAPVQAPTSIGMHEIPGLLSAALAPAPSQPAVQAAPENTMPQAITLQSTEELNAAREAGQPLATPGVDGEQAKQLNVTQQQLAISAEALNTARQANEVLSMRLAEIEKQQANLKAELAQRDAELERLRRKQKAAAIASQERGPLKDNATAAQASSGGSILLFSLLLLLALGTVGVGLWMLLRRRPDLAAKIPLPEKLRVALSGESEEEDEDEPEPEYEPEDDEPEASVDAEEDEVDVEETVEDSEVAEPEVVESEPAAPEVAESEPVVPAPATPEITEPSMGADEDANLSEESMQSFVDEDAASAKRAVAAARAAQAQKTNEVDDAVNPSDDAESTQEDESVSDAASTETEGESVSDAAPYEEAVNNDEIDTIMEMVDVYMSYNRRLEAMGLLQDTIKKYPEFPELRLRLCRVHAMGGNREEFDNYLATMPESLHDKAEHIWDEVDGDTRAQYAQGQQTQAEPEQPTSAAADVDDEFGALGFDGEPLTDTTAEQPDATVSMDSLELSAADDKAAPAAVQAEDLESMSVLDESAADVEQDAKQAAPAELDMPGETLSYEWEDVDKSQVQKTDAVMDEPELPAADGHVLDFDQSAIADFKQTQEVDASSKPAALDDSHAIEFDADTTLADFDIADAADSAQTEVAASDDAEVTDEGWELDAFMTESTDGEDMSSFDEELSETAEDEAEVFDLGELAESIADEAAVTDETGSSEPVTTDPVALKIELAESYISMGDKDLGREILEDVLPHCNAEQRQQVEELLVRIAGEG